LKASEIEPELKLLINRASSVEPGLANRLDELRRWIKDKKPGLLTSKRFVIDFLLELIADADFLLNLKVLSSQERQEVFDQMTPTERYWYNFLFPRWFNESDPKLSIWKQKMMSGEFTKDDESFLNVIVYQIERTGGTILRRYIVDLSMATDLIVSSSLFIPLCVQLTSVSDELSVEKKHLWEKTLRYWGIERAFFVSFNPVNKIKIVNRLANEILLQSDHLPSCCYAESSIDP
jgi:hypothetical protein